MTWILANIFENESHTQASVNIFQFRLQFEELGSISIYISLILVNPFWVKVSIVWNIHWNWENLVSYSIVASFALFMVCRAFFLCQMIWVMFLPLQYYFGTDQPNLELSKSFSRTNAHVFAVCWAVKSIYLYLHYRLAAASQWTYMKSNFLMLVCIHSWHAFLQERKSLFSFYALSPIKCVIFLEYIVGGQHIQIPRYKIISTCIFSMQFNCINFRRTLAKSFHTN